jgi:hypothetical protein
LNIFLHTLYLLFFLVTQCLTHTAENVKAADQLCRETKSNQQVPINRTICYLDYKQSDPCNPEVCNSTFKNFKKLKFSRLCHFTLDCNYRQNYFQISFPLINIFSCICSLSSSFFIHSFYRCTSSTH